ncbi:MAG: hypothetical protein U0W24_09375 [Bacteroidales bacterium]
MKNKLYHYQLGFVLFLTGILSCAPPVSIDNERAILADVQGTWTGYQANGNFYQHFKLRIENDIFKGWVQTSDSKEEPIWKTAPDEEGNISLGSILQDSLATIKFRKFAFTCANRCCGDRSFSQKTLAQMITYVEGEGLMLDAKIKMNKR